MSHKNKYVKVKSNDVNKPKESFWKRFFKSEINFFTKLGDKTKKLLTNEPNFVIFLIMTFTLSIMFEQTGLSRTLPFVLLIPFLIGIFYGRRKATMLHTVIAAIILGTVSGDAELTAVVIIVGLVCSFSGLYLSKYLDNKKKENIFLRILKLIFAGIMCIFSFTIYAYYFGIPTDYFKAKNAIEAEQIEVDRAVYQGIAFNAKTKTYDALYTCINDDLTYENVFLASYNASTGELVKNVDETVEVEENLSEEK